MAQLAAFQRPFQQGEHDRFAVEVKHVRKAYGPNGEAEIYSDLHFQLLRGTFVALVGPIGSGKTPRINMFAGLERPTAGTITVMGREYTKLAQDAMAP